jgi:Ca2+-transporting ATPase
MQDTCLTDESRAALLLFFVLLFRFLAQLPDNDASSTEKGQEFMDILIVTVTVIVVAIPGMPCHLLRLLSDGVC